MSGFTGLGDAPGYSVMSVSEGMTKPRVQQIEALNFKYKECGSDGTGQERNQAVKARLISGLLHPKVRRFLLRAPCFPQELNPQQGLHWRAYQ